MMVGTLRRYSGLKMRSHRNFSVGNYLKKVINEHIAIHNPGSIPTSFIDAYLNKIVEDTEKGVKSSFNGQMGHWSLVRFIDINLTDSLSCVHKTNYRRPA